MRKQISALVLICAAALPPWAARSALTRQDIQWLDRVTYGPTTVTVDEYVKLGRRRFLSEQLHPRDERANLFQDRDYPVLNEYRAVLGGLFASLWGLSSDQLQRVFPASTPVNLNLV